MNVSISKRKWIKRAARGWALLLIVGAASMVYGNPQDSTDELKIKLNSQYLKIEQTIRQLPSPRQYPVASDFRRHLREWQDDLAQAFAAAANTVKQILKLNPDSDYWRDRLETLELYAQPVSSPNERSVFSAGEMDQSARIVGAPAATYTDEARARKVHGDVRLRVVFAADRTVKDVFPIKSLPHGLTDAAMTAASRITFDPAIRHGQRASQFVTLVYEFKNGEAAVPYVPKTIF
jgi:TonB family protein